MKKKSNEMTDIRCHELESKPRNGFFPFLVGSNFMFHFHEREL